MFLKRTLWWTRTRLQGEGRLPCPSRFSGPTWTPLILSTRGGMSLGWVLLSSRETSGSTDENFVKVVNLTDFNNYQLQWFSGLSTLQWRWQSLLPKENPDSTVSVYFCKLGLWINIHVLFYWIFFRPNLSLASLKERGQRGTWRCFAISCSRQINSKLQKLCATCLTLSAYSWGSSFSSCDGK